MAGAEDPGAKPAPAAEPPAAPEPAPEESKPAPAGGDGKPAPAAAPEAPKPAPAAGPPDAPEEEKPAPREYTPEEIAEIARRVGTPADQTPPYEPRHVLSKEFGGASSYEAGLLDMRREAESRLAGARAAGNARAAALAADDMAKVECLHENYSIGMNVFRTAKGGRDKLRE